MNMHPSITLSNIMHAFSSNSHFIPELFQPSRTGEQQRLAWIGSAMLTPMSDASTVPGDDDVAKEMARQNNALRLAELEQTPKTPQDRVRKSLSGLSVGVSTETLTLDYMSQHPQRPPLGRSQSVEILKVTEPSPSTTTPPTSLRKGSSKRSNKPKLRRTKGPKRTCKKQKHNMMKTAVKSKPRPPASSPPAIPADAPQEPAAAAMPATTKPAETPLQPVATPVRSHQPLQPPVTSPDVAQALNRAATHEQLPPTSTEVPTPPDSKNPDPETEKSRKQRKPKRDLAYHARRMRFYRSLDSHGLKQTELKLYMISFFKRCFIRLVISVRQGPFAPEEVKRLADRARDGEGLFL